VRKKANFSSFNFVTDEVRKK